jgi:molybdopterin-guanine dinucleotide biosynthesis protein A
MTPSDSIAGVILAGGRATRMGGGDKALLPLDGQPLLAHVISRLSPQVAALVLNANGDPTRFAAFNLPILPDTLPGQPGPLAGVLAGLDWAASQGFSSILTVAADTPFLPGDLAARLATGPFTLAASPDTAGVLRQHPTIGHWPVTLRDALRTGLQNGERKVGRWALENGAQLVAFHNTPDPFFNVNTPDDLQRAEERLR